MKPHRRTLFLTALLLCCAVALAQQPPAPSTQSAAPNQLPSSSMSAADLEQHGDDLRTQKSYADALDYYRLALRKQPTAVLANKMGIVELQMARFPEARKSFEKSTKIDKKYADAYNNLGVIYYLQKKYGKAIKYYEKAIKYGDSASFHSNLGTAYFADKQLQKALPEYTRAMQLDPEVFEHRSTTGVSAQMSSPDDRAQFAFVLARMYAASGNLDRSLEYLRKAIEDGYKGIDAVYQESEFATLRKDKRFSELMASRPVSIPQ